MPLTLSEQKSIEYHLGFVVNQQVLVLTGNIVYHQVTSQLRGNIAITPEFNLYRVREALCECQRVQDQIKAMRERFGVRRMGDIEIDAKEGIELLDQEYLRWTKKLADIYGGVENCFSLERQHLGAGRRMLENY